MYIYIYIIPNFKLSNEKAQFVTREHEIKYDIKPTSSFSEPAFLLTMFHPMFPKQLGNLLPLCKNSAGNRIKIKFSKYYHIFSKMPGI